MTAFHLVLLKPSHYDDDGYVIQWWRSGIPSNTLAVLYAMARDASERRILGPDVAIRITVIDETNTRVNPDKLATMIQRDGGRGIVGLAGVQSNQYPRAMDIARSFRQRGIQVCIGGFHVSGVLSMLPEITPEVQEALDLGISIYAGESEGRFDDFLRDAYDGALKPIYNHLAELPGVEGIAPPFMPSSYVQRTVGTLSSFDAGRGCPFVCSFCTIINVHGRKSRFREPDDIERIVRDNARQGIKRFFVTDDNFARNKNWEAIFDRLIELKEREGLGVHLTLQVDTQCHKIPRFIHKAARAGTKRIFLGLENVNPDNLAAANKKQNKITEYRKMLQIWRAHRVFIDAGYILGFPGDTADSIRRDIRILQSELPLDRVQFYCLTPLPGSADHKALWERGEYMDPDLNKYDVNHVTSRHPRMTADEWSAIYREAWRSFYSLDHIKTLMRRGMTNGISTGKLMSSCIVVRLYGAIEGIHPLEAGLLRRRRRRDRRPGMPLEHPLIFYPNYLARAARFYAEALRLLIPLLLLRRQLKRDPDAASYMDRALMPVTDDEMERLEIFTATDAAAAAVDHHRKRQSARRQGQAQET
jgi:radical SAM superfamily enzyme YgiQ (UPF0313 family)